MGAEAGKGRTFAKHACHLRRGQTSADTGVRAPEGKGDGEEMKKVGKETRLRGGLGNPRAAPASVLYNRIRKGLPSEWPGSMELGGKSLGMGPEEPSPRQRLGARERAQPWVPAPRADQ